MIQVVAAYGEEFRLRIGATDTVKKISCWLDADADVIHELFHARDVRFFGKCGVGDGFMQGAEVI